MFAEALLLEHHPTEPSSYIIANLKLIPVTSITVVMPQANTWARHIYKYSDNGTLLIKVTNEVSIACRFDSYFNVNVNSINVGLRFQEVTTIHLKGICCLLVCYVL